MEDDQNPEKRRIMLRFKLKKDQEQRIELVEQSKGAVEAPVSGRRDDGDGDDEMEEGEIREEEEEVEVENNKSLSLSPSPPKKDNNGGGGGGGGGGGLRVCAVCKKGFPNGKALGGHMRVHNEGRAKPKPEPVVSNPDGSENRYFCPVVTCGRGFAHKKALYGHMRSHPERDYRGMRPPPAAGRNPGKSPMDPSSSGSSSGSGYQPFFERGECSTSCGPINLPPVWREKGKRGRMAAVRTDEVDEDEDAGYSSDDSEKEEAAEVMYHLANAGSSRGGQLVIREGEQQVMMSDNSDDSDDYDEGAAKVESNYLLKKRGDFDEDELYFLQNEFNINYQEPDDNQFILKPLEIASPPKTAAVAVTVTPKKMNKKRKKSLDFNSKDGMKKGKKKKKKKKVVINNNLMASIQADDDDDEDDDNGGVGEREAVKKVWKCNTCQKTFPTHQALGGHRSSHNKDKQAPTIKIPNPNYTQALVVRTRLPEYGSGLTHEVGSGDNGSGDNGSGGSVNTNNNNDDDITLPSTYKCKTCGERFPTERALGGHQRSHYAPQSPEPDPEQTPSPIVLRIDLNVAAEEEDGVVDNTTTTTTP